MMIMLVIVLILAAVAAAGVAALVGSVVVGSVAASFRQTRLVSPIFLVILPSTVLGALAGCFGLGYWLVMHVDEHLLFWGPVLGLVAGAGAGAGLGVCVAAVIWWRATRRRNEANAPARLLGAGDEGEVAGGD